MRFMKRICLVLLAVCLIITPVSLQSLAEQAPEEDYQPISIDNEFYSLSISEEDGRFTLTNKKTGALIHSYPDGVEDDRTMKNAGRLRVRSAVFVTLFDKNTQATTNLYSITDSVNEGGMKVTKYEKEYIVEYHFTADDVIVPVHYTLDGERLVVSVLPEEIKESGSALLMDISIHPYFFSGTTTDVGYLLVPDGSGALIDFNNQKYNLTPYKQKVYGDDLSVFRYSSVEYTQPVLMPVFGVGKTGTIVQEEADEEDPLDEGTTGDGSGGAVTEGDASAETGGEEESSEPQIDTSSAGMLLGIITGGAGDAYVNANPGIDTVSYNGAYASFNLLAKDIRSYEDDNRLDVDIYPETRNGCKLLQVTYLLHTGEDASYADMAGMYREYLVETYGLTRIQNDSYPLYLDLYMSTMRNKSMLGVPYLGVETLTTFKQAQAIIEQLHENNIPVVARLNNWSDQTVRGKVLSGSGMMWSVGSKKDLQTLKKTLEGKGGSLYLNANISEVYKRGLFNQFFDYAKNMRKATIQYQEFNIATNFKEDSYHYLLSLDSILKYTETFGKSVSKLGFDTIGIDGLSNMFTDYGASNASMTTTALTYAQAAAKLKESGMRVALSGGNQYALGSAALILDLPSSDSMFEICDEAVPFYAIALHGYVPFAIEPVNASSEIDKAYLQTLETGSGLYFQWMQADAEKVRYSRNDDLYNANAGVWIESAISHYQDYASFMVGKQSLTITAHERLTADVVRTTYEDGSYVVVNYGDTVYEKDGLRVEAMSYAFGKDVV